MIIKNREEKFDEKLRKKAISLLKKAEYKTDYKIYCVSNNRGYCDYERKIILVPLWSFGHKNKNYWVYYLAHELSHAINKVMNGQVKSHGNEFMEIFKMICPKYLQHYELNYKPRNAKAAGIKKGA